MRIRLGSNVLLFGVERVLIVVALAGVWIEGRRVHVALIIEGRLCHERLIVVPIVSVQGEVSTA